MAMMTTSELVEAAYEVSGGSLKDLAIEKLYRLMTVTQFVTDLCLNEIERREELTYRQDGMVIVPYMSEHRVDTILNRG